MMVSDEKRIKMAARLYEARTTARTLFAEHYEEKLAPYRKVVRAVAEAEHGGNEIGAVTTVATKLQADPKFDGNPGVLLMMLMAAAVEEIEARDRAKTPEQRADELLERALGKNWKTEFGAPHRRERGR